MDLYLKLVRVDRAAICNGKWAASNVGKLNLKGYCGETLLALALLPVNFVSKVDVLFTI